MEIIKRILMKLNELYYEVRRNSGTSDDPAHISYNRGYADGVQEAIDIVEEEVEYEDLD